MLSFALLTSLSKLNLISLMRLGKPSNVDGMMKVSWPCSHCLCSVCVCLSNMTVSWPCSHCFCFLCPGDMKVFWPCSVSVLCVSRQHEGFLAMFLLFLFSVYMSRQHEGFLAMFLLFLFSVYVSRQCEGFQAIFLLFLLSLCLCTGNMKVSWPCSHCFCSLCLCTGNMNVSWPCSHHFCCVCVYRLHQGNAAVSMGQWRLQRLWQI